MFSQVRAKMCLLFDVYFNLRDLLKALFILYFSIAIESVFLVREKNLSEILGNLRASTWLLQNFKHVWTNRLEHWSNPKISHEMLVTKFIRIGLQFPLCVTHSKLAHLYYHNLCLKYENTLIRL